MEIMAIREAPGPYNCRCPLSTTHSARQDNPNPLKSSAALHREKYPLSALGASRLYNEAEIRVLLSDTPADLPGGVARCPTIFA